MSNNIRNKAILKAAGIPVFAAMFCIAGCYDLGLEPTVKPSPVETFTDIRDGHVYKKVKIGKQTWMAENLKFEAEGSVCYSDPWGWTGSRDPAENCETYGRLYDWNTAMNGESSSSANPSGVEGVCPMGWHLPSDDEWMELIDYVGENAGKKLKSADLWRPSNGTDLYGFSALPGGMGIHNDSTYFIHMHTDGNWWTAGEDVINTEHALMRVNVTTRAAADKHT